MPSAGYFSFVTTLNQRVVKAYPYSLDLESDSTSKGMY